MLAPALRLLQPPLQRSYLILGGGLTGTSACKYLAYFQCNITLWDDDPLVRACFLEKLVASLKQAESQPHVYSTINNLAAKCYIPAHSELINWSTIDAVIVSPGINFSFHTHPLIAIANAYNIPCVSDISLFLQAIPKEDIVIGVTGTNGKTTVTALICHILNQQHIAVALGNNEFPVLEHLYIQIAHIQPSQHYYGRHYYVLELSSHQLDLTPNIERIDKALWYNFAADHQNYYPDLASYFTSKARITNARQVYLSNSIIQAAHEFNVNLGHSAKIYNLSHTQNSLEMAKLYEMLPYTPTENIAAATQVVQELVGHAKLLDALATFKMPNHRYQKVAQIANISFINDSKATNIASAIEALKLSRQHKVIWFAGGIFKGGDLKQLIPYLDTISQAYFWGKDGKKMLLQWRKITSIRCLYFDTMAQALDNFYHQLLPSLLSDSALITYIVLLSPACASLDQFKNYAHRGQEFNKIVSEFQDKYYRP